ncbi:zinc finger protein 653 [Guaruba guarouba]
MGGMGALGGDERQWGAWGQDGLGGAVPLLCLSGGPQPLPIPLSKPWEQLPKKPKRKKRRRRNVNCLRHAVLWYEDHRQRCPYEPALAELDPSVGLFTTAVWQCERGHRYFQDLHSPLRPLSDSEGDDPPGSPSSSSSSSGGCSSGSEAPPGGAPQVPGGVPVAEAPPGPPPAPPTAPPAPPEDSDVSTIIYEIPQEPQRRRRSRQAARPPPAQRLPPPEQLPGPWDPPSACRKRFEGGKRLRRRVGTPNGSRDVACESCGRRFKHRPRGGHSGDPP